LLSYKPLQVKDLVDSLNSDLKDIRRDSETYAGPSKAASEKA
jgi:hypothetical protein